MKAIFNTIFLTLFAAASLAAQHSYGPYSPGLTFSQEVGNANFKVETTRPIARGREIFGGLVPYDKLWFTGAGGTFITIDRDVEIAGQLAPASRYGLYIIPTRKEWTVILSRNPVMPDSPDYDPELEIRVCLPVQKPGRFRESWSVEFDLTHGGANMYLAWTDAEVVVPINTSLVRDNTAFIDSLAAAPLSGDAEEYYRAMRYLSFNKQAMDKAVFFGNHVVTLEKEQHYYIYEALADAYAYLGEKEKAINALNKAADILPREFPGETEVIAQIMDRLNQIRSKVEKLE